MPRSFELFHSSGLKRRKRKEEDFVQYEEENGEKAKKNHEDFTEQENVPRERGKENKNENDKNVPQRKIPNLHHYCGCHQITTCIIIQSKKCQQNEYF